MRFKLKLLAHIGAVLLLVIAGVNLASQLTTSRLTPSPSPTTDNTYRIDVEPRSATNEGTITIRDAQGNTLASFSDEANNPRHASLRFKLPVDSPTETNQSAFSLVVQVLVLLAGVAIIYIALNHLLLTPIRRLSTFLKTISAANNLSLRVPSTGSQAVSELEESVNTILDTTEFSYLNMMNARFEAERAHRGTSLFVAKVSHELRTPIHGITGMLRILLKQEQSEGKRHYIQMAQDSANTLLKTINEILDFSKMQSGDLSLEEAPCKLSETVRSTIEQLIPRFEEKPEVALCWDIHPGVPEHIIADSARIKNILVNLLGNAFKFTEKGSVTLEIRPVQCDTGAQVRVSFAVIDTGIGIAQDKLQWVFDPFTTADERSARLYTGTGLGLPIVKQIAERMGGVAAVDSTIGVGSTFTVEIPLTIDPALEGSVSCSHDFTAKRFAIAAEQGPRLTCVTTGLRRFGCEVMNFSLDQPGAVQRLLESVTSFDCIHIIKSPDLLMDELTPVIQAASRHEIPLVISALSSELLSTTQFVRSETFFETLQPTSALDLLLMTSGKLVPTRSLNTHDEEQEVANHKLNILIADDAKTNRIILKTLLEEAGHSVEAVENGQQLLERMSVFTECGETQQPRYDLVLTDIQMPIMDGMTATQSFRELESKVSVARKLPIVAVTSHALPEECSKMLASGIDHIITKPISPKRLSSLISQITCEVEVDKSDTHTDQSDQDVLRELSRIADSFANRMQSLTNEVQHDRLARPLTMIDIHDVFERSGNSLRRTGLILNGFLESYQELVHDLFTVSSADEKGTALRRVAHSLKGLLLDIGATEAAALASALEQQAVHTPSEVSETTIRTLCDAVRSIATIVQEIAGALPSVEVFSALPLTDDMMALH